MQISGSNYSVFASQSRLANPQNFASSSASTSGATSQSSDQAVGPYTAQELKDGFFGCSRATVDAALAAGQGVNTLAFLLPSDIDLIQKTTGITIKDGSYFNSSGQQVGLKWDSTGDILEPDASQTRAAFDLAQSLSEMRESGGPGNSTNLMKGGTVTADDLQKYLDAYASAAAAGEDVYRPDTAVIDSAEAILKGQNARA